MYNVVRWGDWHSCCYSFYLQLPLITYLEERRACVVVWLLTSLVQYPSFLWSPGVCGQLDRKLLSCSSWLRCSAIWTASSLCVWSSFSLRVFLLASDQSLEDPFGWRCIQMDNDLWNGVCNGYLQASLLTEAAYTSVAIPNRTNAMAIPPIQSFNRGNDLSWPFISLNPIVRIRVINPTWQRRTTSEFSSMPS